MIYRFQGFRTIPMDMKDIYSGSCFIIGGSPSIFDEKWEILKNPGITCIGMNNVSASLPGVIDILVSSDIPQCYDKLSILNPKIQHFSLISRAYEYIELEDGSVIQWKDVPNTFFFQASEKTGINDFLSSSDECFAWWKNTFPISIQLAYYLGFRKIYIAGCTLIIKDKPYSYGMELYEKQIEWNNKTYSSIEIWMKNLKSVFKKENVEIFSCTKDSLLNKYYDYISIEDAVNKIMLPYPKNHDFSKVKHSSDFVKK